MSENTIKLKTTQKTKPMTKQIEGEKYFNKEKENNCPIDRDFSFKAESCSI